MDIEEFKNYRKYYKTQIINNINIILMLVKVGFLRLIIRGSLVRAQVGPRKTSLSL